MYNVLDTIVFVTAPVVVNFVPNTQLQSPWKALLYSNGTAALDIKTFQNQVDDVFLTWEVVSRNRYLGVGTASPDIALVTESVK